MLLPAIERSAGKSFLGSSQAAVASGRVTPAQWYRPRVAHGLVWVATADKQAIGFAATEVFEDSLHLWELAVRLEAEKAGAGRALMKAVIADTRARSLPAVTLTTFRDIPWNAPFYASLGFVETSWTDAPPRLAALRAHEARRGLNVDNRCLMRLVI